MTKPKPWTGQGLKPGPKPKGQPSPLATLAIPPVNPVVQTAGLVEQASRVLARRNLMHFIERINPQYKAGWVHKDICERLERFSDDVAAEKSPRLMLLLPPRHGKSEIASRNFPAWHLGQFPDHEFIACSYNMDLATDFSRKVKMIIEEPAYHKVFPGTRLDPDNRSAEKWIVHGKRGGYVAAGVGGGITGRGAHVLVIDDPIKAAEEADSADNREKLWQWYLSTSYSRLAPGGGVLIIQCMTGDTPVLMADKTERRLDALVAGDEIATYASGILASSRVSAIRSNGCDSVLKITTSSGKIVRANQRHPFLTVLPGGGVTWTRAKHLTTAHRIVALKASGANGRELPALRKGVKNLPNVADYAQVTTPSKNGPTDTDRQASIRHRAEALTSNTGTGSPLPSTTRSSNDRVGYAPSVESHPEPVTHATGKVSSPLTTATTQGKSGDCSATTATQGSGTLPMSQWHVPPHGISDFTLDEIVSIEQGGEEEEVFDLQVEHTENFIANGLVSHNTWWHDDDLAGRIQTKMRAGVDDEYIDQFEVVKYPAIAEHDEWYDGATRMIVDQEPEVKPDPATTEPRRQTRLLRKKGEPLHPERYSLDMLKRIRAQNEGGRWWSALYQQNPVPDDGAYFMKDNFRYLGAPNPKACNAYIAWDFAISTKAQNDYTVGTVVLQDEKDVLHVVEQVRFRSGDAFFIVEAILDTAKRWYTPSLQLGFEDGQIYRAIESLLRKRMRERQQYPAIQVLKPITDKLARARPLQGRMQQGMVSFPKNAEWADTCRLEMLRFPAGAHDDCVDSLAWATQMAIGRQAPRSARGPDETPAWLRKLKQGEARSSFMGA